jgi:aspartyl-tRNA(Asn)/glutamyl-tRNA(Gln) amidotransferase subunit B
MAEIVNMLDAGKISDDAAVQIIRTILDKGGSPRQIVSALGLTRAGDDAVLRAVREAVAEGVAAVEDFRAGNERALNYIVGMVMKKTKGRADPAEVHRLVMEEVKGG